MTTDRRVRRITQWVTSAALVAWLLLLLRWHAWDRGLVADHWRIEGALLRGALALSGLAVVGELSLLRSRGRASWLRFAVALLPLILLCERWWRPSEGSVVAIGFVIAAAFVIGFGSASARVRVSALMLGGIVCVGALCDLHFGWRGRGTLSAVAARNFADSYWLQRMPLAAAAIGFATTLGSRRSRWPAAAGFVLAIGAGALELLGTRAARQVEAAASSDSVFPVGWSVDQLARTATFVESGLAAGLVSSLADRGR